MERRKHPPHTSRSETKVQQYYPKHAKQSKREHEERRLSRREYEERPYQEKHDKNMHKSKERSTEINVKSYRDSPNKPQIPKKEVKENSENFTLNTESKSIKREVLHKGNCLKDFESPDDIYRKIIGNERQIKCPCPNLIVKGFSKEWQPSQIEEFIKNLTAVEEFWVKLVESPVPIGKTMIEGCFVEFKRSRDRDTAYHSMKDLVLDEQKLEPLFLTEMMKRMLRDKGYDIVCSNHFAQKEQPAHSNSSKRELDKSRADKKEPIDNAAEKIKNSDTELDTYGEQKKQPSQRSSLKRELDKSSDNKNTSVDDSAKKFKNDDIDTCSKNAETKDNEDWEPCADYDTQKCLDDIADFPFNMEKVYWRNKARYEAVDETYGLRKSVLDRLGITPPLTHTIRVKHVNPFITDLHSDKLMAIFSLAGHVDNIEIKNIDGKERVWLVHYHHPVEAVQVNKAGIYIPCWQVLAKELQGVNDGLTKPKHLTQSMKLNNYH